MIFIVDVPDKIESTFLSVLLTRMRPDSCNGIKNSKTPRNKTSLDTEKRKKKQKKINDHFLEF
ncbi:hypothetical protein HZS_5871 [Henneguya salminicola]|nr:hypothetical protein HZS_5871 [Henneguya salminicola]